MDQRLAYHLLFFHLRHLQSRFDSADAEVVRSELPFWLVTLPDWFSFFHFLVSALSHSFFYTGA
jgi:hypothetical protein